MYSMETRFSCVFYTLPASDTHIWKLIDYLQYSILDWPFPAAANVFVLGTNLCSSEKTFKQVSLIHSLNKLVQFAQLLPNCVNDWPVMITLCVDSPQNLPPHSWKMHTRPGQFYWIPTPPVFDPRINELRELYLRDWAFLFQHWINTDGTKQ